MTLEQVPQSHWAQALAVRIAAARQLSVVGFGELRQSVMATIVQELPDATWISLDDDLARMRMDGAAYYRLWLTVLPAADRPRYWPEENRNYPSDGDQVLIGVTLTGDGDWAHGLRMGSMGPAHDDYQRMWAIVDNALSKAGAALGPQAMLSGFDATIADHVETAARAAGWTDIGPLSRWPWVGAFLMRNPWCRVSSPNTGGPGCSWPAPGAGAFESGMVLELHPNLFVPGLGEAALGEMYLIGNTGAEPILRFPHQMFEA